MTLQFPQARDPWNALEPHHRRMLEDSGITPEVANARGYRSVSERQTRAFHFSNAQSGQGLLIPIHGASKAEPITFQLRRDEPRTLRGKVVKYETPNGSGLRLDVNPMIRERIADPAEELWITEGTKKADAAISAGVCCVALSGVYAWRGKNEKGGPAALPDWEAVPLRGPNGPRRIYLAFDSDLADKVQVRTALDRLRKFLGSRGADVLVVNIPASVDGAKVGLDDHLAAGGTIDELRESARPALELPRGYLDTIRQADDALFLLGLDKIARASLQKDEEGHRAVDALRGILFDDELRPRLYRAVASESLEFENVVASVGLRELGETRFLAGVIRSAHHFASDAGQHLHVYEGGVYRPEGSRFVEREVQSWTARWKRKWASSKGVEVVRYVSLQSPDLWERPHETVVNVRNGLLDTRTRALQPHDPTHLSTVQLPVVFDPDATCPAWEKFLADALPEDAQGVAWEILAWLMQPSTRVQAAVLFLGKGGTGKSTLLAAMRSFLGKDVTSAYSPNQLESNRFAVAGLLGKLANMCADLPSRALKDSAVFKAITGGDALQAERKNEHAFTFTPFARLVFSANQIPHCEESDAAFAERWIVIPMDQKFRGEAGEIRRDVLDAQLSKPRELSGALNRALDALPRVLKAGITVSKSMAEARSALREADHVAMWLEESLHDAQGEFVTKDELYLAYTQYVAEDGRETLESPQFGKSVRRWRPELRDAQRIVDGMKKRVWLGVAFARDEAS